MERFSKGGDGAAGNLFATLTTLLAIAALARNFLPPDWIRAIRRLGNRFTSWLDPFCYYTIQEFTGQSPDQNYEQVKQYLSGKGTANARRYVHHRNDQRAESRFDHHVLTPSCRARGADRKSTLLRVVVKGPGQSTKECSSACLCSG